MHCSDVLPKSTFNSEGSFSALPLSSSPFYLLVLMILCDLKCGITFVLHVPPKLFLSSAQILVFKTAIVKLKSSAIKVELNFR